MREIINGILYILVAGCAWYLLPHEQLRQWVRAIEDRHPSPSAAILDSQSVETATMIHPEVGYDGGKKTKGRKRHLLVDTLGLMMMVVVTAASLPEREGAKLIFEKVQESKQQFFRLITIWVDGEYRGIDFIRWVMDTYRWIIETVMRSDNATGFLFLPRRWVVERTFGWFNWCRRLSKDYEVLPETSEAMIQVAMIRLMLKRLAT